MKIIDILVVDEFLSDQKIQEYGNEGYALIDCQDRGLFMGKRYIFVKYEYRILRFFLSELDNGYFGDRTINLLWSDDYIPQIGDRFNPLNFFKNEEIKEYLKYEVPINWLTNTGIEAFKLFVVKGEGKTNIYEFLKKNLADTFIAAREYIYDKNQNKDTFHFWLQNKKT